MTDGLGSALQIHHNRHGGFESRSACLSQKEEEKMKVSEYLKCLESGEVPPSTPTEFGSYSAREEFEKLYMVRDKVRKLCMYALVDMNWTAGLASWIGSRSVLEIMAGKGWLAKALSLHGVDIVATDTKEWHKDAREVYPVKRMSALKAVKRYANKDILICSWPYMDGHFYEACRAWEHGKPIVHIGEGYGGCTANDAFFENFVEVDSIAIPQWRGIHDCVQIGRMK